MLPATSRGVDVPEVDISLAIAALEARRAVLTGGDNSVGVQEQRVAEMRAALDEAAATLAACVNEVDALDAAIAALSPAPIDPEVSA
jgi:hypothetical protein